MPTITKERQINGKPQDIYRALATPEGIRGWWSTDCDVSREVGADNELRFDKNGRKVVMRFRIDELEPDARVKWTCVENGNPAWVGTTLEFSLRQADTSVVFTLEHDGFTEDQSPLFEITETTWNHFADSLKSFVETGTGQPWG